MTEQDWARSAVLAGSMPEYRATLLAWSDWLEEEGIEYYEGLRWLESHGKFPDSDIARIVKDTTKVMPMWYNMSVYDTAGKEERYLQWMLPYEVFRELRGYEQKAWERNELYKVYKDFLTAIREASLAYQRS